MRKFYRLRDMALHHRPSGTSSEGRYDEVEQMHQETLEVKEKMLGKDHRPT